MKLKPTLSIILIIVGIVFLILGIVLWFIIPLIVRQKMNDFLPLDKKTVVYNEWKNTSLPIYMQFWFFNVVNVAEVENGSKPSLVQVGPYCYREYRLKENITFDNNGSVSYRQRRIFEFDRSKSVGGEDDVIWTVSIPLVVIGDKLRGDGIIVKMANAIVAALGDTDVMMQVSVGNITWGYEDPVLKAASEIAKIWGHHIDPIVGLFYGKNNTDDGEYVVDSGSLSLTNFLDVRRWRGEDHLPYWNSKSANMINGSDGSMFAPFLNDRTHADDSPLYVFQSDICRSIYATHSSSPTVRGIPARQYTPPYAVFANHTENPANFGFCVGGVCLGSGVLNLSTCQPTAPVVVMSQPHLYQAADKYQNDVYGLHPSTDCITSLSIEPTTGLPLDLQKKLQINIAVTPVPGFAHMGRLRSMLLPVMWLNESVAIDAELAALVTNMLIEPVRAATGASIGLMVLGPLILMVIVAVIIVRSRRTFHNYQGIINDNEA